MGIDAYININIKEDRIGDKNWARIVEKGANVPSLTLKIANSSNAAACECGANAASPVCPKK